MSSTNVTYADKYSDSADKYNLTQLEDELKALTYPPSIQCNVQYALPPPDRYCGKTQDIDFMIQGTSKGYLSFPVEVVEVNGEQVKLCVIGCVCVCWAGEARPLFGQSAEKQILLSRTQSEATTSRKKPSFGGIFLLRHIERRQVVRRLVRRQLV